MVRKGAEEGKRGRKVKKVKDPNEPKRPQNGYMRFAASVREEVKAKHNLTSVADIAKKIGEMWKAMPETKKAPFEAAYKKEKAAYDVAIAKYKAGGNARKPSTSRSRSSSPRKS